MELRIPPWVFKQSILKLFEKIYVKNECKKSHNFYADKFWNCIPSSVYVNVFQHHLDILSDMPKQ